MNYFLSFAFLFLSCWASGQTLLKQTATFPNEVPAALIYSNGQKILVGCYDTKLYVVNAASGEIEKEIAEHKGFVLALAYNAKQNIIASAGGDKRIIIWDAANMTKKLEFEAHTDRITALAFSPDGSKLLSGSEDKTAVIWDVLTGGEVIKITDHSDAITTVAYSKDGNTIATGGWDKTVMLHSATTGQLINSYKGHRSTINSVDFSYKGDMLVSGSDDNSIIVWRTDSVKTIARFDFFSQPVTRVVFFPGDKYIFCADGAGELKVFNIETKSLLAQKTIHDKGIKDMYIYPVHGLMVTTGADKTAKFWNINEYVYFDCMKEKTKAMQDLAKPKGEFETTEMYEKRMREYDIKKSALISECAKETEIIRKAQQDALENKMLSTYAFVYFPLQSLGTYNADSQEYPISFNNTNGIVKLGLEEAKSLKAEMTKAKVKAIKRVVNGTTEYINTELILPVSGKSVPFGKQITPAEDNVLGKFLQNH